MLPVGADLASMELAPESLTLLRPLGAGNFGEVNLMIAASGTVATTAVPVAVKSLTCTAAAAAAGDGAEDGAEDGGDAGNRNRFLGEAQIMAKVRHPNLVALLGVCTKKAPLLMVLEYLSGGSLEDWLAVHAEALPMSGGVGILRDVAKGMQHLHHNDVLHRDLAARNVLIGPGLAVKVADFGLAREAAPAAGAAADQEPYYRVSSEFILPLRWLAPEVMQQSSFAKPADVYSFGILVWEVFQRRTTPAAESYPFAKLSNGQLMDYLCRADGPPMHNALPMPFDHAHCMAPTLIACLRRVPRERPEFSDLVRQCDPAAVRTVGAGAAEASGGGADASGGEVAPLDRAMTDWGDGDHSARAARAAAAGTLEESKRPQRGKQASVYLGFGETAPQARVGGINDADA